MSKRNGGITAKRLFYYRHGLVHILLLGPSLYFLLPFLWMMASSFKLDSQFLLHPLQWIPVPFHWPNYGEAVNRTSFFSLLQNTMFVAVLSALGVMVSCSLAAYSLAALRWTGRRTVFIATLGVMMVPGQVTMIPEFMLFQKLGLVGTLFPLILKEVLGVPMYVFLLRQYALSFSLEFLQAARIDGSGEFRIFYQIFLPQALPAVWTVGLFQMISSWQDFLGPLLYLNDPTQYTLTLALQQFQSEVATEWGLLMAASVLMVLPIIALFFCMQKLFFQGITIGAIKV